jgi:3-dehydroquinate dehydratase
MVRVDCLFVDVNLPSTNKQSSLTINVNKQTVISHHYHQQTNNHLSPLTSTNKQSSLTITINKQDDCLFVDANGER